MKAILFFTAFLLSGISFSQQKLLSSVFKQYASDSSIVYEDSISYVYYTWQGSITHFKPELSLGQHTLSWEFPFYQEIPSNEEEQWYLNPTTFAGFTQKTIYDSLVLESLEYSHRILNTFDASGNKTLKLTQFQTFPSTSWTTQDSALYQYDNLGNMTYSEFHGLSIDTMWFYSGIYREYVPGTSLIKKIIHQNQNGDPGLSYVANYNGTQIDYIDHFNHFAPNFDANWLSRTEFAYLNGNIENSKEYAVQNGTLLSTAFINYTYQYDNQNQITKSQLTEYGNVKRKELYEYISPGFVSKFTIINSDSINQFFNHMTREFTYLNTLSIEEPTLIEVQLIPNPTQKTVKIITDSAVKQIRLLNMNGQVLLEQNTNSFNVEHLPSGTYILSGSTERGWFSEKFVKE